VVKGDALGEAPLRELIKARQWAFSPGPAISQNPCANPQLPPGDMP
jgi:hypothetical protein